MLGLPSKAWLMVATLLVSVLANDTRCYTSYGSSSQPSVPTKWHTRHIPCTSTRTSVITTSTHPPGQTITTTTTITRTISTTTTTVATSPGFLPIASTFPDGPQYNGTVASPNAQKRDVAGALLPRSQGLNGLYGKSGNPQSVDCNVWTRWHCSTTITTVTSTAKLPPTYTTKTVTSTTTTALTTATYYEECANNNFAYLNNAIAINQPDEFKDQRIYSVVSSPYDCCVAGIAYGITNPNDTIITVGYLVNPQEGGCVIVFVYGQPTCVGGQVGHQFEGTEDPTSSLVVLASNTNCGEIID